MLNHWHRHNVQSLTRQCSITDVNMFSHWYHNVNHWRHNAQPLTSQCSITEITIVNHWCQSSQYSLTDITILNHGHHNGQSVMLIVTMLNHWRYHGQSAMLIGTKLSHWRHNDHSHWCHNAQPPTSQWFGGWCDTTEGSALSSKPRLCPHKFSMWYYCVDWWNRGPTYIIIYNYVE